MSFKCGGSENSQKKIKKLKKRENVDLWFMSEF